MKPELRRVGHSQSPVVVIDEFSGNLRPILAAAEALAPYPRHTNYYPGLRRIIQRSDEAANAYVEATCNAAAQFIAGAFEIDSFTLLEASFSMVTALPQELTGPQSAPHFDTTDSKHLALLHYLNVPANSGTAFYRQRSTGIEQVDDANVDLFVRTAQSETATRAIHPGYINGSDEHFEQIASVAAFPDRLVIYQGSLLHSGIIPPDMNFSSDPGAGRLTANLFVRGN